MVSINSPAISPHITIYQKLIQSYQRFQLYYNSVNDSYYLTKLRAKRDQYHLHTLVIFSILSFLSLFLLFYYNGFAAHTELGPPYELSCRETQFIQGNYCGINGIDCQPFQSSDVTAFRCARGCLSYGGGYDETSLVGGLNNLYTADSYICAAALHSGIISSSGGCAAFKMTGPRASFLTQPGQSGLSSLAFHGPFPSSFSLFSVDSQHCEYIPFTILGIGVVLLLALCLIRPPVLFFLGWLAIFCYYYAAFTMIDRDDHYTILVDSTQELFILFIFGYVVYLLGPIVALYKPINEPRGSLNLPSNNNSPPNSKKNDNLPHYTNPASNRSLSPTPDSSLQWRSNNANNINNNRLSLSNNVEEETKPPRFVIDPEGSGGEAYTRFSHSASHCAATLSNSSPSARVLRDWYDLFFLYVVPCLVSVHWTYIPIVWPELNVDLSSTFFSHGAVVTAILVIIIIVLVIVVAWHVRLIHRAKLIRRYVAGYACMAAIIVFLSLLLLGKYSFHLHHVLAPLLLIPFTRFSNRFTLFFQAFLLGISINGLAVFEFTTFFDPVASGAPAALQFDRINPLQLFPLSNSTTNSLQIIFPVPVNSTVSAAVGAQINLNGVELFHGEFSELQPYRGSLPDCSEFYNVTNVTDIQQPPRPGNSIWSNTARKGFYLLDQFLALSNYTATPYNSSGACNPMVVSILQAKAIGLVSLVQYNLVNLLANTHYYVNYAYLYGQNGPGEFSWYFPFQTASNDNNDDFT
jgi:hypothetical protein